MPGGNSSAAPGVPMFARMDTLVLLLALFLFATGAAYLVPGMEQHAQGASTTVSAYQSTGSLHLVELAMALGISFVLVMMRWRGVAHMASKMVFFTAAAVLAMASFFWSIDPMLSLRSGVYLLMNTLLVYYLVQRFTLEGILRLLMGLGVVVAVMSAVTAVLLPTYAWGKVGSQWGLQGAFIAKNVMGNVAVLLLTPALFVRSVRTGPRAIYVLVFLIMIALSLSVQAWAAALFCLGFAGVVALFLRLRTRDAAWLSFVTLLPLVIGALLLATYWVDILEWLGKDVTLSGRTVIWSAVLRSVEKRPLLGWGYNAFWQGFRGESGEVLLLVHFPIAQSQNGPLEVLLGLGVAGLGLIGATLLQAARNIFRCFRLGATEAGAWYLLIILLTLYYSIGEAYFEQPNTLAWMLYILACTGLLAEVQRSRGMAEAGGAGIHESSRSATGATPGENCCLTAPVDTV